jgi:catechol 2,3-dioxygenase-like lactoylglutathione lyase family enzyme
MTTTAASTSQPTSSTVVSGIHQLAYVTNDIDRALATFAATHGIEQFMELRALEYQTVADKQAKCNVALAYLGPVQVEVIQPLAGDVQVYRDFLPSDASFGLRFHHVAHLYESDEALERGLRHYQQQGRRVPVDGAQPGAVRYFYVDLRDELGHYIEAISYQPASLAWLETLPHY